MSERTEETSVDDFVHTVKTLGEQAENILRVRSQWFLEIEMPVNEQGDPMDGPTEEDTATSWMICTGVKDDRDEILKILDFRKNKNPEDNVRIVREDIFHIVEDAEE